MLVSVRIDVDELLRIREEERLKAKKEAKSRSRASPESPRKRKTSSSDENIRSKKLKVKSDGPIAGPSTPSPFKIKLKLPLPMELEPFPCCLCVSRDQSNLLCVANKPGSWAGSTSAVSFDENGAEFWKAHESCAMVIPETWVDDFTSFSPTGAERTEKAVFGVDSISRDRWNLVRFFASVRACLSSC